MKKILLPVLLICIVLRVPAQVKMQGTIKPGTDGGTIEVYLKPSATFSQKDEAMSFALALPATLQPAPSLGPSGTTANGTGVVPGITGLQPNFLVNNLGSTLRELVTSIESIDNASYYIYTFLFSGTATNPHNWKADEEQKVFSIAFNGCTANCNVSDIKLVSMPYGGSTKNAYWYFQPNTLGDITNYPAPFYSNSASGALKNGGSNDGSTLSILGLANTVLLPLKLSAFYAAIKDCEVQLTWQIQKEANIASIAIERASDNISFTEIGKQTSYTSFASNSYTDDNAPLGNVYYRLRFVDNDGKFSYSTVKQVNLNCRGKNRVLVYPNPAKGLINIVLPVIYEKATIKVLDASGKVVSINENKLAHRSINVSKLPYGSYIVRIITNNEIIDNIKIELAR
jgi:hypothetical protein